MAEYCRRELDDAVHRLLPPEIFMDIGIAVEAPPSAVRRSCHAVVEELAEHLASVLGLADMREQHAPPPYMRKQGDVGGHGGIMPHCAQSTRKNGVVFGSGAAHRLSPTAPFFIASNRPPTRCHGSGTGVFLPRAEAYQKKEAAFNSTSLRNGAKPPRMLRKDGAMIAKQQQLRAMAAQMEQKKSLAAAFHGCTALRLPQEWTY